MQVADMSTPSRAPPTLTSLPNEILSHIISHLDIKSAKSLGLTSRHFRSFADAILWKSLSIYPNYNKWYGIPPTLNADEARVEDARLRASFRRALLKVMGRADERRWSMVKSLEIDPPIGTEASVETVLSLTAPSLEKLLISLDYSWRDRPLHTSRLLDYVFGGGRALTFPNLREAVFARGSFNVALLPSLLAGAPDLRFLEMVIDDDDHLQQSLSSEDFA